MTAKGEDLHQREQAILDEIIQYYMDKHEAISARTLSKISRLSLSPTTIRNLMEDLSAEGLLTTEGATRGRVPTQKAFAVYVTRLGEQPVRQPAKAPEVVPMEEGRPARLYSAVRHVGRFLAMETGCAAVAELPQRDRYPLDWVKFASLGDRRVLVTVGTLFGDVWSKVLLAADPFPDDLLGLVGKFINEHYRGRSFDAVRQDIMVGEPKRLLQDMPSLGATFRMLRRAFEWEDEPERLHWGLENLYDIPEFQHPSQLQLIYLAMNQPGFLGHALERARRIQGGWIAIGTETGYRGLENCALVAYPFGVGEWQGRLAVLGPMRLHYARVFSLVERSAESITHYLHELAEGVACPPQGGP